MKAILYLRFSSDKQQAGFSIEEQEAACRKKANAEKHEVVKVFVDKAQSAKTRDRPMLAEMLLFIKKNKNQLDALYIYDISRLSRNQLDFLIIKNELSKNGVIIRSVQGIPNDSLEGDLTQDLLARIAQYKNQLDAKKIKAGLYNRFKSGLVFRKPRGYEWEINNDGRKSLAPGKDFELYKRLWLKVAKEKLTIKQAIKYADENIPNSNFSRESMSNFLKNKIYFGVIEYKGYSETVKGVHEPMIEEKTYWEVRSHIEGRSHKNLAIKTKNNPKYPLTKILYCPSCKGKITAAKSKGKSKYYEYYFCRNRKTCKYNMPVSEVHKAFEKLLSELEPTKELMTFVKEMMREKYELRFNQLSQSAKWVEKDIRRIEKAKVTLLDNLAEGIISKEDFQAYKERADAELIPLKTLLNEKEMDKIDIEAVLNFVEFYMTNLHKIWVRSPIEGKIAMQCSTFPKGIYFSNEVCRTPELAPAFKLNRLLAASKKGDVLKAGIEPA